MHTMSILATCCDCGRDFAPHNDDPHIRRCQVCARAIVDAQAARIEALCQRERGRWHRADEKLRGGSERQRDEGGRSWTLRM